MEFRKCQEFSFACFHFCQTFGEHLSVPIWGWHFIFRTGKGSPKKLHGLQPLGQAHGFDIGLG